MLLRPGKAADWVSLSGEVMRGGNLTSLSATLGTDAGTVSFMLAAWARRAAEGRYAQQPIGAGKGWWPVSVLGYTVAVGVQRGGSFRVIGWDSGPGLPTTSPISKVIKAGASDWLHRILDGASGTPVDEENRLWIALARTNAWPMV